MYRAAMEQLHQWKEKKGSKPLIIRGARQVGKTWLMKEFGSAAYQHTVYINFENNRQMEALFSLDFDLARLVMGLELYAGQKIDPKTTLILFDEVQEVPLALTSLKYFHENAPQYRIICAGSLLGITLHKNTSFPVGKVEFLDLYPLSLMEFMLAMGEKRFVELLQANNFPMATTFRQKYIELLK
ncbi:MAG: AAA family ATPase, partial [Bacillota bacterium]